MNAKKLQICVSDFSINYFLFNHSISFFLYIASIWDIDFIYFVIVCNRNYCMNFFFIVKTYCNYNISVTILKKNSNGHSWTSSSGSSCSSIKKYFVHDRSITSIFFFFFKFIYLVNLGLDLFAANNLLNRHPAFLTHVSHPFNQNNLIQF